MIAREGNQRTDSLAVSNRDRQPIAAHIMISRIVKKCSNGRVILGQFIPVERQNRLASPSNDRIDSGVLFLEIARLPRDRIRTNRTQQVCVLTFLRTQRNIRDMQHPDVGGDRLQRLFEIWFVFRRLVVQESCPSAGSPPSQWSCFASTLLTLMVARQPHRARAWPARVLWEGDGE